MIKFILKLVIGLLAALLIIVFIPVKSPDSEISSIKKVLSIGEYKVITVELDDTLDLNKIGGFFSNSNEASGYSIEFVTKEGPAVLKNGWYSSRIGTKLLIYAAFDGDVSAVVFNIEGNVNAHIASATSYVFFDQWWLIGIVAGVFILVIATTITDKRKRY